MRVGELHISNKKVLVFKNKKNGLSKANDRKKEIMQAIHDANQSYTYGQQNLATTYDVDRIASDVLSMHSGSSYYVSVHTPRTKARSVISSKYGTASQKRGKNWSFFKNNNKQRADLNKTATGGFNRSGRKSNNFDCISVSQSQKGGIAQPEKLFENKGISDNMKQFRERVFRNIEENYSKASIISRCVWYCQS